MVSGKEQLTAQTMLDQVISVVFLCFTTPSTLGWRGSWYRLHLTTPVTWSLLLLTKACWLIGFAILTAISQTHKKYQQPHMENWPKLCSFSPCNPGQWIQADSLVTDGSCVHCCCPEFAWLQSALMTLHLLPKLTRVIACCLTLKCKVQWSYSAGNWLFCLRMNCGAGIAISMLVDTYQGDQWCLWCEASLITTWGNNSSAASTSSWFCFQDACRIKPLFVLLLSAPMSINILRPCRTREGGLLPYCSCLAPSSWFWEQWGSIPKQVRNGLAYDSERLQRSCNPCHFL